MLHADQNTSSMLLTIQEKIEEADRHHQQNVLFERRKEVVMGIKYFWLIALTSHPALSLLITAEDSKILCHLVDMDVTPPCHQQTETFEISFTFSSNAFFFEQTIVKKYTHTDKQGRLVSTPSLTWKPQRHIPTNQYPTFFTWLTNDAIDSRHLGELLRTEIHPRAIELYLGTYPNTPNLSQA